MNTYQRIAWREFVAQAKDKNPRNNVGFGKDRRSAVLAVDERLQQAEALAAIILKYPANVRGFMLPDDAREAELLAWKLAPSTPPAMPPGLYTFGGSASDTGAAGSGHFEKVE